MSALVLEPLISGNTSGETILFVQGWPDDATLWDETVESLGAKYRCVRVNMPNFGEAVTSPEGHSTEEIVNALVGLIRRLAVNGPISLVVHDWGSYWGHAAHHRCPELVARIAGIDVAPHFDPPPRAALAMVAYQSWLFAAYKLGGRVGDWMTRRMAKLAGAPLAVERIRSAMNYPYRNIFQDLASGRAKSLTRGYWPECPILFVYGARKPFHFHSQRWTDHVRRVGGEVIALPSNHWVPKHPEFVTTLRRFLERDAPRADVVNRAS